MANNVDGLRLSKTVNGQATEHVWDGNKQIIADVKTGQYYDADCYLRGTNLVATYSFENGERTEYTYYTQNAHGDVVNLTDSTGAVTKSYTYDAFGVEINQSSDDTNVLRFCGEYFDTETGTIYLRARYYQAFIGRFISRDSYAGKNTDPLSLNLYTYCHNNPIFYVDPSGHNAFTKWVKNKWEGVKSFGSNIKEKARNIEDHVKHDIKVYAVTQRVQVEKHQKNMLYKIIQYLAILVGVLQ